MLQIVAAMKEYIQSGEDRIFADNREQIIGTFEDDPIYDEAMKLGRHYRQSLRPNPFSRRQK
jgi:hypothetical protein